MCCRYIKKHDLKEAKSLMKTQLENENSAQVLESDFDRFNHPESNRIMSMVCIITIYTNYMYNYNNNITLCVIVKVS